MPNSSQEPVVYVVNDDAQACQAVSQLIHSFGREVRSYQSPAEFLDCVVEDRPGCVLLDLRTPGMDGMELHRTLKERGISLQVIVVTASAETPQTVESLRNGAVAMLDKPARDEDLWNCVQEALSRSEKDHRRSQHQGLLEMRLKRLSPQDRAVLRLMLEGEKNRTIAKRLGVSLRTVENRRRRVFDVMEADSVAQLTRSVVEYEHNLLPINNSHEQWLSLPFEREAAV
ncbi:response regulator [Pirellulales bacterium]|nr:response regulator [Pirellulales bacterium]